MVKAVINKNGEIEFINENREDNLATFDDVLDKLAEGNECGVQDGDLIRVREGIGVINDDNGFELLIFKEALNLKNDSDISYEMFEEMQRKVDFKLEYYNGAIHCMSPASPNHNIVSQNLLILFRDYLKSMDTKCRVFTENVAVVFKGKNDKHEYEPDIMVICDKDKFVGSKYYGVPLLIIEVLSPSTKDRDEGIKKDIYLKYGVAEYWMVYISDRKIKVCKDNDEIVYKEDDTIETVIGNKVEVKDIFEDLL